MISPDDIQRAVDSVSDDGRHRYSIRKRWIWHRDTFTLECPHCHRTIEFSEKAKDTYGYFISLMLDRCPDCGMPTEG